MSGVYTNLAKMRSDQNKEAMKPEPAVVSPAPKKLPSQAAIKHTEKAKMFTNPQTDKPTNQSPIIDHLEKPEKYTTHLEPSLVKKLKLHATERDLKDYQVIKQALLLYFEKEEKNY